MVKYSSWVTDCLIVSFLFDSSKTVKLTEVLYYFKCPSCESVIKKDANSQYMTHTHMPNKVHKTMNVSSNFKIII